MAGRGWQGCLKVQAGLWFECWTDDDACVETEKPKGRREEVWVGEILWGHILLKCLFPIFVDIKQAVSVQVCSWELLSWKQMCTASAQKKK